ncbi:MAG: DUF2064 domain-containing protein [Candidatus Heimdallarchaeota archaeon]|nr:DUF2064 domain-containing protein [Candidatus Heimdallarchaeota archaeon]
MYEAFLLDTIEQSNKSQALQIIFSLTDTISITSNKLVDLPFFNKNELINYKKIYPAFHIQSEGIFGSRMKDAIKWVRLQGYSKIIVLGADSPQIQPSQLNKTILFLDKYDVVLGPSAEAGIYLIGINDNLNLDDFEKIFEGVELSNFAKFVVNQNLSFTLLSELGDIDQESDLVGLISWLESVELYLQFDTLEVEDLGFSIPKNTFNTIRKLRLKINVDDKNNRGKVIDKIK